MDLTWLGTAGFIVKGTDSEIAFDPFLSRGQGQPSPFTTSSFGNTQALFVGHGHFDHAYDIPAITLASDLQVYAPGLTGQVLKLRGVPGNRLRVADNKEYLYEPMKVRAFKSQHVRFDLPLVLSTIKRCGVRGCLQTCGLGLGYPKGLVQSYLFELKGKKILFMSSAGASNDELLGYRKLEIDYLLAPLQGHS
ncbi:MAG: MBL fold metallo-hydrolase, partial [Proteobacteria bacterium]